MELAGRDLVAAKAMLGVNNDWAYNVDYNAMLQAVRALMYREGFRPAGEGQHKTAILFAELALGEKGIKEIGAAAKTTPTGTEVLDRVFKAAEAPVLVIFDEALNFLNRNRNMADHFYAFIQNLTVAMTGTTYGAAVMGIFE